LRRLLRELLHFARHYRETLSSIAGARCLDRRVQCQQIGPGGDFTDHLGYQADA
jgi:hypothetical protein